MRGYSTLAVVLLIGCHNPPRYSGNQKPTTFRATSIPRPGKDQEWKRALFIEPAQVILQCGRPTKQWVTQSDKMDSPFALVQTHLAYEDKGAEVQLSKYPNAKNEGRNWFYSGIFPPYGEPSYSETEATKRMPCLADKAAAWQAIPS